jgi:hypothetical protein
MFIQWRHNKSLPDRRKIRLPVSSHVEPVEKVNSGRIWSVGRKSDLSECSVFNDIMLARGQETPENTVLTRQKTFPIGSLAAREVRGRDAGFFR